VKTIAIVAVEKSGDVIGADLIRSLKSLSKDFKIIGVCGPKMRSTGCETVGDIEDLSVMGIVDVAKNYFRLKKLQKELIRKFMISKVDAFVGVDGPDFNLGIGRQLKKKGVLTTQYVCPQAWAWRERRTKYIQKSVDLMFALFPFEESYFSEKGIDTRYVGHPIADTTDLVPNKADARINLKLKGSDLVVALMPGSRLSEIERHSAVFLKAGREIQNAVGGRVKLLLGCASPKYVQRLAPISADFDCEIIVDDSRTVLTAADVALVVSGTVTLEGLLCDVPVVVAYKTSSINYQILKRLIKSRYISLPNILTEMNLVPELLQDAVSVKNLSKEALGWLSDVDRRSTFSLKGRTIHRLLRQDGSRKVAKIIFEELEKCQMDA